MSNIELLNNELRSLTAGGEPKRHQFHKMPLDDLDLNQRVYLSILDLGEKKAEAEVVAGDRICGKVAVFKAGKNFAVLDESAKEIKYLASYEEVIQHGRKCATDLQLWRRGFIDLYDQATQVKASAPSFLITRCLIPEIPILATLKGPSCRFWWHRVHDAFDAGYLFYDASDAGQVCSRADLIDRNVDRVIISAG